MVPPSGHDVPVPDPTLRPLTAASTPTASTSLIAREALRVTALADAQASLEHIAAKPRSPVSPGRQSFPILRTRQPIERDAAAQRRPAESAASQPQTVVTATQDRMNGNTGAHNAQAGVKVTSYANAAAAPPAEGAGGPPQQPGDANNQQGRGQQPAGGNEQGQGQQQNDAGTPPVPPRPKQLVYTFPSPPADTADLLGELEEFYSYVEVPQVLEHYESWKTFWKEDQPFTEVPEERQHEVIQSLLSKLLTPSSTSSDRHSAARHLLHIAHGTFAPDLCPSPEHHLHLILTNCRSLRQAGALPKLWQALKRTAREWEDLSHLPIPPEHEQHPHEGEHDDQHLHPNMHNRQGRHPSSAYSSNRMAINAKEEEAKAAERQERLEEANAELALLLAVLYFMTECSRGDETWGDELMSLEPPMPVYLYNQVAGLRERNAKGYPVKKLLLLLWKSMLCTLGGLKDVARVKTLVREVEGLPLDDKNDRPTYKPWTKATPPDILAFRNETLAKYPSYTPPASGSLLPLPAPLAPLADSPEMLDRISAAAAPIPVRPTFSYHINANHDPSLPSNIPAPPPANWPGHQQPPTPAPSPPPTPPPIINQPIPPGGHQVPGVGPPAKPKKQQFQTDQTRPFPLPFAPANAKRGRAVPRAIEEAGELYRRNLRISTELWQAWKVREEFRSDEMGWTKAAEVEREREVYEREKKRREAIEASGVGAAAKAKLREDRRKARALGRRLEELALGDDVASDLRKRGLLDGGGSSSASSVRGKGPASDIDSPEDVALDSEDEGEEGSEDPMDPLSVLHGLMRQLKRDIKAEPDEKRRKELEERRADVQRLERVERLYRMTLPHLQSAVIVLLKLLLATVTANQNLTGPSPNAEEPQSSDPPPDLSLEDIDILRHREITSKAVSAILILTLKWFKASHIMKFHYFSQLLVDSNCLLLILKMFGMQEVSTLVRIRHEKPDHNFFKFCNDHLHPSAPERPEDALLSQPPVGERAPSPAHSSGTNDSSSGALTKEGAEIELVSDYSWRNFFSTINFVHILQKLTKRKTHRVLLMVQYKSSAILKRILKVSHPTLQLFVLKVIKSQVPYCGRKWRQSNMKVITAIYLHCRPDLRDEWLAGIDVDADVEESLPHEQALRSLVRFFNTQHYGQHAPGLHRRSSSVPTNPNDPSPDFNPGPVASVPLPPLSPHGPPPDYHGSIEDVFPPPRAISSIDVDAKIPLKLAYGSVELAEDLEGYEVDDLLAASGRSSHSTAADNAGGSGTSTPEDPAALSDGQSTVPQVSVVDHDDLLDFLNDPLGSSDAAWERLGLEGYEGEWDDVSDSESVGGWGFMRFGVDDKSGLTGTVADDGEEVLDERSGRIEWEHISPETITALEEERAASSTSPAVPNSPRPPRSRRRSSTGPVSPALRPVLIDRDDDGATVGDAGDGPEEEGPAPMVPHEGPAIDEVELVFNR
ncbi:hypothetical protein JCM10908_001665 [Rhodotorula pacifica]|uniref:Far11p n=1 Tax=Rhodotorula pacifica TaxID=1495444 RepID=UPI003172D0BC